MFADEWVLSISLSVARFASCLSTKSARPLFDNLLLFPEQDAGGMTGEIDINVSQNCLMLIKPAKLSSSNNSRTSKLNAVVGAFGVAGNNLLASNCFGDTVVC